MNVIEQYKAEQAAKVTTPVKDAVVGTLVVVGAVTGIVQTGLLCAGIYDKVFGDGDLFKPFNRNRL
jgi:hypothetical protein